MIMAILLMIIIRWPHQVLYNDDDMTDNDDNDNSSDDYDDIDNSTDYNNDNVTIMIRWPRSTRSNARQVDLFQNNRRASSTIRFLFFLLLLIMMIIII